MKVTLKMLDKQLRLIGWLMRFFLRNMSEKKLGRMARLNERFYKGRKPKDLQCVTEWLPRPDGTKLRVLVYKPLTPVANAPGLLWLHGGGYAMGVPEIEESYIREFIATSNCVVVSPDYRLSLEAPYPAALEDAYAALVWMKNQAGPLGLRTDQLVVGGESAGGGLAAAVALVARDQGEVNIAFQMPLYPMLDDRSRTESARENDAPVWDSTTNRTAWQLYLGPLYGQDTVPAYAAPARATDYRQLPPTITYVGDVETFRDETIQFVQDLRAAGVPVDFQLYKGAFHGFDTIRPNAAVSQAARAFLRERFRSAIQHHFREQPA